VAVAKLELAEAEDGTVSKSEEKGGRAENVWAKGKEKGVLLAEHQDDCGIAVLI
jgi:hypothetical protein